MLRCYSYAKEAVRCISFDAEGLFHTGRLKRRVSPQMNGRLITNVKQTSSFRGARPHVEACRLRGGPLQA